MRGFAVVSFCSTFLSTLIISYAVDTITANQTLRDGKTIVSAGGIYELGFFSPGNSKNRYLGIWYKKISARAVVWVANRDFPLTDPLGTLNITNRGIVELVNSSGSVIWSSSSSRSWQNPVAQLLDTGNFVVRDGNNSDPKHFLWQSFDYPSDTFLPGMKLGKNLESGLDWYLTSWKSTDDPSQGDFTYRLDLRGLPQLILRSGTAVEFRSGPWNGLGFSGFPQSPPDGIKVYSYVFNQEEVYYHYESINSSVVGLVVLSPDGILRRFTWVNDRFKVGFVPKVAEEWALMNWSKGCVRRAPLDCKGGDGWFRKYSGVKLPDTGSSWFNDTMNSQECEMICLKNCSCTAYANLDIRGGGSGCILWFGDLIDMRQTSDNVQDLHVRMATSETDGLVTTRSRAKKREGIIAASAISGSMLLLGLALILFICKRKNRRKGKMRPSRDYYTSESRKKELELPLYDLATIVNVTNNFSDDNKLGEGGFGPVYKGKLIEGQEIAVKRLSKNSTQGLDEFKNEVAYIAKLQHRNLVKLLGCCIEAEEKMLIYEYMPNKSLDYFIFNQKLSTLLDWPKRFNVINGIARGLLYLHQDSRLRIVHRDLKADNILLDHEMNPKISDFGLARSFRRNETEASTNKVVGTHGYISPEYAVDGLYSVKSDVFSFGVLMLEMLSGRRNRRFYHPDHHLNLLGHAWQLFLEGRSLELVDASVRCSWNACEILRSVHIGLLCVQQYPEDRPSMSSVALMLSGEGAMPRPKQPGFYTGKSPHEEESSSSKHIECSANGVTITQLEGR